MNKLLQMARHAYQTVPIYYNLADEIGIDREAASFDELPVVSKRDYIRSGMSVLSSKYMADYMGGRLIWMRTSGSTGKSTEIYWKKSDYQKSLLSLWLLRKRYYGIVPADRLCYFFPADVPGEEGFVQDRHCLAVSREYLYNGCLSDAYERILEYDPVWMILQPSVALLLCEEAVRRGTPSALRYIEMTGEYLETGARERIKKVFSCQVADQYGSKEVNSIAFECPEGRMHVMSDNVYVETVDGPCGDEICVTSLQNHVMPLIRFNLEDRGRLQKEVSCPCGRCGDVLELEAGRSNDWIKRKDGGRLHAYALMQIVQRLNYMLEGMIIQYQIEQRDYDKFLVRLVLEEEGQEEEIQQVLQEGFSERLQYPVQVVVEYADELLPAQRTGKLACFSLTME